MRLYRRMKKIAVMNMCCILIVTFAIFPERAAGSYQVLQIALLASSLGAKFASVFVETSAQDSYDQYLNAAVQADLSRHRNDYTGKRDASVILSRVAFGFVGVATLLSIFNQLDLISQRSSSQSTALRLTHHHNYHDRETSFRIHGQF